MVLLVSCVGCDQVTKDLAREHLAAQQPMSWFSGTVRLEYAENAGAFLSLGAELPDALRVLIFQALMGLGLTGLLMFLIWSRGLTMPLLIAWTLILSGGIGNLLDRAFYEGRVIDFMNLGIGSLRTGIFNVADVCIAAGVVLLIVEFRRKVSRQLSEEQSDAIL